jgi:hypothetical protein
MWRERLARQRLQAELLELRLKLSEQQAAPPGLANFAGSVVDDCKVDTLAGELAHADTLARELRKAKVG